jgi:hypothetical protein
MKIATLLVFLAFLGINLLIVFKICKNTHYLYKKATKINYRTVREFRNDGFQLLGGAIGGVVFVFLFTRVVTYFGDKPSADIASMFEILEFLVLMFCVAMIVFLVASKEYIQTPEDETEMSSAYSPLPKEN